MDESDFNRIKEIVDKAAISAANEVSTTLITQTVAGVLKTYGIHDPEKMQKLMVYGKACMQDKQNLRRGFFNGIGGHLATILISLGGMWAMLKAFGSSIAKGLGG